MSVIRDTFLAEQTAATEQAARVAYFDAWVDLQSARPDQEPASLAAWLTAQATAIRGQGSQFAHGLAEHVDQLAANANFVNAVSFDELNDRINTLEQGHIDLAVARAEARG
jgi:hypothetical protein